MSRDFNLVPAHLRKGYVWTIVIDEIGTQVDVIGPDGEHWAECRDRNVFTVIDSVANTIDKYNNPKRGKPVRIA